jgi:hypothetical protein
MSATDKLLEAASDLSDDQLRDVLQFVERLKSRQREPKPGSVDAVLRAVGNWWLTPRETEQFLHETDELRHVEDPDRDLPPQYEPPVALLNDDPRMAARLPQERAAGSQFAITTIALGELYYGAYCSRRVEE